jgi:hypothetical protein
VNDDTAKLTDLTERENIAPVSQLEILSSILENWLHRYSRKAKMRDGAPGRIRTVDLVLRRHTPSRDKSGPSTPLATLHSKMTNFTLGKFQRAGREPASAVDAEHAELSHIRR